MPETSLHWRPISWKAFIYRALGLAADFGTDVPASDAVVLLAIHLPHLVNDMYRIS